MRANMWDSFIAWSFRKSFFYFVHRAKSGSSELWLWQEACANETPLVISNQKRLNADKRQQQITFCHFSSSQGKYGLTTTILNTLMLKYLHCSFGWAWILIFLIKQTCIECRQMLLKVCHPGSQIMSGYLVLFFPASGSSIHREKNVWEKTTVTKQQQDQTGCLVIRMT